MGRIRWWHCGLVGATALSLATLVRVVREVLHATFEVSWTEAAGFAAVIFAMGFVGGVIAWAGRRLYQWLGMAGDALVGMVLAVLLFAACMLLLDDAELRGDKLSNGLLMLALGAAIGLVLGAWVGRDLRKWVATEQQRRGRLNSGE